MGTKMSEWVAHGKDQYCLINFCYCAHPEEDAFSLQYSNSCNMLCVLLLASVQFSHSVVSDSL